MKFFALVALFAFVAVVAASIEQRAIVTVTTLDTITSCAPEITACPARSTSSYANSTYSVPVVSNTSVAISTFTGAAAAAAPAGIVAAGAAGLLGFIAYLF
ncbi:uncharacterized protein V1516DRAFT_664887 [Lipomyces oligophaga]|uniref:uncharacterized protein n=1 Tax=Lipomyces oligophaga TaxID=45792 RepID=UPI0034CD8398